VVQAQAAQIQYFQPMLHMAGVVVVTLETVALGMALMVALVEVVAQMQARLQMEAQEYQDKDMLVELMEVQARPHIVLAAEEALGALGEMVMLRLFLAMVV